MPDRRSAFPDRGGFVAQLTLHLSQSSQRFHSTFLHQMAHSHDHSLAGILKMKGAREPVYAKRETLRKLLGDLRKQEAEFIEKNMENLMEKEADEWLSILLQLKIYHQNVMTTEADFKRLDSECKTFCRKRGRGVLTPPPVPEPPAHTLKRVRVMHTGPSWDRAVNLVEDLEETPQA